MVAIPELTSSEQVKFHLLTLGCPKNVVDSEAMTRLLVRDGHLPVATARQADVIIVNTCGFIDIAKQESLNVLAAAGKTKRRGQVLIAAGCLAERFAGDLQSQVPHLDAVLGTRHWDQIPALVARLGFAAAAPASGSATPSARPGPRPSAYLKIADGCDSSCAFCVIPQIKGPYQSKPVDQVLAEAQDLAGQGVQEIVLVAQDTTLYGSDLGLRDGLASLLEQLLEAAPAVPWWRIMYAYPQHITPRLIRTMAGNPHICRYLDLPLQHAHPDTLQRMGRPTNVDQARELIGRLREAMPGIALRSSFIVGYPGETEAEFAALLALPQGGTAGSGRLLHLLAGGWHRGRRAAGARVAAPQAGALRPGHGRAAGRLAGQEPGVGGQDRGCLDRGCAGGQDRAAALRRQVLSRCARGGRHGFGAGQPEGRRGGRSGGAHRSGAHHQRHGIRSLGRTVVSEACPICLTPIGYVRNQVKDKGSADVVWEEIVSEVVLDDRWLPGLDGLGEFSHIWVIAWLGRVPTEERGANLQVHPRGRQDMATVGLFATRTPRRPNPIAITAVPLLGISGAVLTVKGLDMLDGTPVLDLKPYLSRGDAIPATRAPRWIRRLWREQPWLRATDGQGIGDKA